MPWLLLLVAGLLEVVWAVGLKHTQGFTRPFASVVTLAALAASMGLLALAVRHLPLGTAYAVWVGIGVLGTTAVGVLALGEGLSPARAVCVGLLVVAIAGLKLTTPRAPTPPPTAIDNTPAAVAR